MRWLQNEIVNLITGKLYFAIKIRRKTCSSNRWSDWMWNLSIIWLTRYIQYAGSRPSCQCNLVIQNLISLDLFLSEALFYGQPAHVQTNSLGRFLLEGKDWHIYAWFLLIHWFSLSVLSLYFHAPIVVTCISYLKFSLMLPSFSSQCALPNFPVPVEASVNTCFGTIFSCSIFIP